MDYSPKLQHNTKTFVALILCCLASLALTQPIAAQTRTAPAPLPEQAPLQTYLRALDWLDEPREIVAHQNALFAVLAARLGHETAAPAVEKQNLLLWRKIRHQKAYVTRVVNRRFEVSDPKAAWQLIAEDLKLCGPLLLNPNAPPAGRNAALAIAATDTALMGAILGDAHAARLSYEGFVLPFLKLANPGRVLWPAQGQLLLDNYNWILRDETPDRIADVSQMMIRYGDEGFDADYKTELADITRYNYGLYLQDHGQVLQAIALWRAIKSDRLVEAAKYLYEKAEKTR